GGGEKMSKHSVPGGDISGLSMLFSRLTERARKRAGEDFPIIAIQEAGLDGFWIHRALEQEDIESHIVDAASIMTSRRRRRAKTDRIDGEVLLRALMAYKRHVSPVRCLSTACRPDPAPCRYRRRPGMVPSSLPRKKSLWERWLIFRV